MHPKILLVEDEKNFGMVMRDYLSMNGYEVTLCENGELGLDAFPAPEHCCPLSPNRQQHSDYFVPHQPGQSHSCVPAC